MWSKPWSYKEGLAIGAGLLIIGILLLELCNLYLVLLLLLSEIDDIFNIQKNRYKNKGHNCYENI